MRVWWCNQSDQWEVERPSAVVCSSDPTEDGGNARYRRAVGEAKASDLVVHYRKPHIVAFSRAMEDGTYHDHLPLLRGEEHGAGWRFRTEYFDLGTAVRREAFGEALVPFRVSHYLKASPAAHCWKTSRHACISGRVW